VQRRVQMARQSLLAGENLAATAPRSGFADQSHLTRAFARQFDVTPSRYVAARSRPQFPSRRLVAVHAIDGTYGATDLEGSGPDALITAIDMSEVSLIEAGRAIAAAGIGNVTLRQADIFNLPFPPLSFDHVFVCFVLEHLTQPLEALKGLQRVLKPGGTMTVVERDHGSTFFHPDSDFAQWAIHCQVALQRQEAMR
jgi:SAM-dependent methyltransferase